MNELKTAIAALAAGFAICLSALSLVRTTLPALAITVDNIPTLDAHTCTSGTGDAAAIACTRAINSGHWAGAGLAWAYVSRAKAFLEIGDYDRALADANEAIRLDPKIAVAYANRAKAYFDKGDYDRAIAEATEAIQLDQTTRIAYFYRAVAHVYAGSLPKATADLNEASALNPEYAYTALWVEIVGQRSNVSSRLSQLVSAIDMTKWPAPVIRLYLGQMTPSALLAAAAENADAATKKGQVCEANFYSGQLALQKRAKEDAMRLFRLAAADCPKGFIEWSAANAELKALGVPR